MLSQDGIEAGGNLWGEGGPLPGVQVGVHPDQFAGGGEGLVPVANHEMHEVDHLGGTPQRPRPDGDRVALPHLRQVADVLFQGEAAIPRIEAVALAEPEAVKKLPGGLVEEVDVPHHVHVVHDVDVFRQDDGLVGDG